MKKISGVAATLAILVLILDSRTACTAAAEAVELCLKTVIPSLFPFIFLSGILLLPLQEKPIFIIKKAGRLFRMPRNTENLLVPALLGGYPVGAQNVYTMYKHGMLTKRCAEKMLFFCSNAGPSFVFGILPSFFHSIVFTWGVWLVLLLSIYTSSLFVHLPDETVFPQKRTNDFDAMRTAIVAMAKVCGWIVIARVLISVFARWFLWFIPPGWKTVLVGLVELTNGCTMLNNIVSQKLRFVACCGMLAFGGVCVIGQTKAVIGELNVRSYCLGKVVQAMTAVVYAALIVWNAAYGIPFVLLGCYILRNHCQKKSSIPGAVGV